MPKSKEEDPIRTFECLRVPDPLVLGRSVPLKFDASVLSDGFLEKLEESGKRYEKSVRRFRKSLEKSLGNRHRGSTPCR